jgi:hypothetical protein
MNNAERHTYLDRPWNGQQSPQEIEAATSPQPDDQLEREGKAPDMRPLEEPPAISWDEIEQELPIEWQQLDPDSQEPEAAFTREVLDPLTHSNDEESDHQMQQALQELDIDTRSVMAELPDPEPTPQQERDHSDDFGR